MESQLLLMEELERVEISQKLLQLELALSCLEVYLQELTIIQETPLLKEEIKLKLSEEWLDMVPTSLIHKERKIRKQIHLILFQKVPCDRISLLTGALKVLKL